MANCQISVTPKEKIQGIKKLESLYIFSTYNQKIPLLEILEGIIPIQNNKKRGIPKYPPKEDR